MVHCLSCFGKIEYRSDVCPLCGKDPYDGDCEEIQKVTKGLSVMIELNNQMVEEQQIQHTRQKIRKKKNLVFTDEERLLLGAYPHILGWKESLIAKILTK